MKNPVIGRYTNGCSVSSSLPRVCSGRSNGGLFALLCIFRPRGRLGQICSLEAQKWSESYPQIVVRAVDKVHFVAHIKPQTNWPDPSLDCSYLNGAAAATAATTVTWIPLCRIGILLANRIEDSCAALSGG